jgi:hypothetical protein
MNVYFSPYKLTSRKAANRLSSAGVKQGVLLRVKMRFTDHFADYFPHEELGDKPIDHFLEVFKYQQQEHERKIFYFLLEDERLRSQKLRPHLNHQLWDGHEELRSPVVKYKIRHHEDFGFIPALKKKYRLRLDANGLFNRDTLERFQQQIPQDLLPFIDYLEDPMQDKDWGGQLLPLAQDFIRGEPASVVIHKPNSRFYPTTDKRIIFSSYMGGDLGRWHAYCELLERGELKEYHGINTPGLYAEEKLDLTQIKTVEEMYQDLHHLEWKLLCSI